MSSDDGCVKRIKGISEISNPTTEKSNNLIKDEEKKPGDSILVLSRTSFANETQNVKRKSLFPAVCIQVFSFFPAFHF